MSELSLVVPNLVVAVLVSTMAGTASAANQYRKERRNEPPTFDGWDFLLLVFTSCFVGMMGYFGASLFVGEIEGVFLITGLASATGWGGLLAVKEILLDMLRKQLVGQIRSPKSDKD